MMSKEHGKRTRRVGEYLVDKGVITLPQLDEALDLQKDNRDRLIGEILVTMGALSKEDLVMSLEMYLMETDVLPTHVDEWLDQEEIDMIIEKMKES
ncbi:MAG: hypothetical protein JW838_07960 [Spirochaetes bacterium]|nr:hypothetical protein [Spirochaetota bacterium]